MAPTHVAKGRKETSTQIADTRGDGAQTMGGKIALTSKKVYDKSQILGGMGSNTRGKRQNRNEHPNRRY